MARVGVVGRHACGAQSVTVHPAVAQSWFPAEAAGRPGRRLSGLRCARAVRPPGDRSVFVRCREPDSAAAAWRRAYPVARERVLLHLAHTQPRIEGRTQSRLRPGVALLVDLPEHAPHDRVDALLVLGGFRQVVLQASHRIGAA